MKTRPLFYDFIFWGWFRYFASLHCLAFLALPAVGNSFYDAHDNIDAHVAQTRYRTPAPLLKGKPP